MQDHVEFMYNLGRLLDTFKVHLNSDFTVPNTTWLVQQFVSSLKGVTPPTIEGYLQYSLQDAPDAVRER